MSTDDPVRGGAFGGSVLLLPKFREGGEYDGRPTGWEDGGLRNDGVERATLGDWVFLSEYWGV